MTDRYCVFGNPIGHSKSPAIHAAFARQTGEDICYEALQAPIDGFAGCVRTFAADGGRGANVTVPFKEQAFRLCDELSDRARLAGAVNTLSFVDGRILGDNTDGAGLIRDLTVNLGTPLAARRILLLGAGGAARGALGPLLEESPREVVVANRTFARAEELVRQFAAIGWLRASEFTTLAGEFDVVVNATAASLAGDALPLPDAVFAADALAYDMMYGKGDTAFLAEARRRGVRHLADGLGMLVEQAAEAFFVWRGVRPATRPVLDALRSA